MPDQTIATPQFADRLTRWLNTPAGVALTAFLALSAAMVKFLDYNQYPVLSAEVGLICLLAMLAGVGAGLTHRCAKWVGLGLLILLTGLALFVLISTLTDGNPNFLSAEFGTLGLLIGLLALGFRISCKYRVRLGQSIVIILLATVLFELTTTSPLSGLGVLVAFLVTRRHFLPIVAVFAITILVTTPLIGPIGNSPFGSVESTKLTNPEPAGEDIAPSRNDRPFILHLILDEHLGAEGFKAFISDPQLIRNDLRDFYSRRGFQVFGGAYSKHLHTQNSIPDILRLGADPVDTGTANPGRLIDRFPYLKEIQNRQYRLSILQSTEILYCRSEEVSACVTYRANGPLPAIGFNLSAMEKAKFVLSGFLTLSPSITKLAALYDYAALVLRGEGIRIPLLLINQRSWNHPIKGLEVLGRTTEILAQAEPGMAYFTHILLPHFPYIYGKACSLKAFGDWHYPSGGHDSVPIEEREAAYVEQIRCSLLQLDLVLAALDNSPVRDNYVVIIHGDHGSRITDVEPTAENVGKFSDRDLIAGFSTLFAVRYPEPRPGYVADYISVDKLLKNLLENDFQAIHADDIENGPLTVILDNQDWVPTLEYNLPEKWPAPAGSVQ